MSGRHHSGLGGRLAPESAPIVKETANVNDLAHIQAPISGTLSAPWADVNVTEIAVTDRSTNSDTTRGPSAARNDDVVPKSDALELSAAEVKSPAEASTRMRTLWPAVLIAFAIFTVFVWGVILIWLVWALTEMAVL